MTPKPHSGKIRLDGSVNLSHLSSFYKGDEIMQHGIFTKGAAELASLSAIAEQCGATAIQARIDARRAELMIPARTFQRAA